MPLIALSPPDSMAVRIAFGLVGKKFVGARASATCRAANSSRRRLDSSRPDTPAGSSVQVRALTRYACFSTSSHGTSSQAGSRNRRSFSSGRATGSASAPTMRAAPYVHRFAHDRASSHQVSIRGEGSAASRDRSFRMASSRRSGSRVASVREAPAPDSGRAPLPAPATFLRCGVARGSFRERPVSVESGFT